MERERFVDLLADYMCSCGKLNNIGIPYQHAMVAIAYDGEEPLNYVFEWFKKDTYLKAYQFLVKPMNGRLLKKGSSSVSN